jgi:hypothetical protein
MSNNLQSYLTEDEKTVMDWNERLKKSSFIVDMIAIGIFVLFAGIFITILVLYRTLTRETSVKHNNNIDTPPLFKYDRKNAPPNVGRVPYPTKN